MSLKRISEVTFSLLYYKYSSYLHDLICDVSAERLSMISMLMCLYMMLVNMTVTSEFNVIFMCCCSCCWSVLAQMDKNNLDECLTSIDPEHHLQHLYGQEVLISRPVSLCRPGLIKANYFICMY